LGTRVGEKGKRKTFEIAFAKSVRISSKGFSENEFRFWADCV